MQPLKNVTVMLFAPSESKEQIEFALSYIKKITDSPVVYSSVEVKGVDWVKSKKNTYIETQREQACELMRFLREGDTHLLHCECDGIPFNPQLWDEEFLQYDYIGAPWGPKGWHPTQTLYSNRVGNGGLSLRSRSFLKECDLQKKHYPSGEYSDVWICQHPFMRLHTRRLNWPDLETALRFSYEAPIPEFAGWTREKSFGLHSKKLHSDIFKI